jgi:CHRD domain
VRPSRTALAPLVALAMLLSVSAGTAAAGSDQAAVVYHLAATGDQEATPTCAPPAVCGDPDAFGRVTLVVIPAADKVCFSARWWDIDGTVVAAHIHPAPAGVPGPVAVPLFAGSFDGSDKVQDCMPANGLAAAINANPSGYYVNIHSSVYGPGAIRAQLG